MRDMDRHIIFKCPQTGLNVQYWVVDAPDDRTGTTRQPVVCQACTKLHFINKSTGKLLGEAEKLRDLRLSIAVAKPVQ